MIHSRSDLLPSIADVVRRRGYDGTTMAELATVTGLGKATIYHHFPGGKAEVAQALARHAIAELDALAARHLRAQGPWNERLEAFVDGFAEYVDGGKANCLLATLVLTGAQDEVDELVDVQMREWLQAVATAYTESGLGEKAARRRARELVIALHGGLVLARLLGGPKAFTQTVKRLHRELRDAGQRTVDDESSEDDSAP
jgi:AcrR family transcriptional regulator